LIRPSAAVNVKGVDKILWALSQWTKSVRMGFLNSEDVTNATVPFVGFHALEMLVSKATTDLCDNIWNPNIFWQCIKGLNRKCYPTSGISFNK